MAKGSRKKLLKNFIVFLLVVICSINQTSTISAASRTIYLQGIIYSGDTGDRVSWMTDAKAGLDNLSGSTIYTNKYCTPSTILSRMKASNMFVIQTHGSQTALLAVSSSGAEDTLNYSDLSLLTTTYFSKMKICVLGACLCGSGGSSANNMVNLIYSKGADCVIGYQTSVTTVCNSLWLKSFCQGIGSSKTVSSSMILADTAVYNRYATSGNTVNRLVRGSTSVTM